MTQSCPQYGKQLVEIKKLAEEFVVEFEKLNSNRKSKRAEELVNNLLKQKEDLKSAIKGFEKAFYFSELGEKLHVEAQYKKRLESLKSSGILEKLKSGKEGIIGIDGKEYPVPTLNQIKEKIRNRENILAPKMKQGFTQILLVPLAMPLKQLVKKLSRNILKHFRAQTFFATNGDALDLDESNPVFSTAEFLSADTEGTLVYFPWRFNQASHGGKTKRELLANSGILINGWRVILLEDLPDLPGEGQGKNVCGRKQLEANKTPSEYLSRILISNEYQNEQGFAPEDWLAYAITHLEEKNQIIDDWRGDGKVCFNIGGYFVSDDVSLGNWEREGHDSQMHILNGLSNLNNRNKHNCARTGVSIV